MHGFDYSVPHFITSVRGTHIVVIPQIVTDVLHVPKVEFPDYPSCDRLRTVSKDKLISAFCRHPSNWGKRQFTYCLGFAKGPWFLNMIMTFVLHPLSHYNSITKSRARFLLSFLSILPQIFLLTLFCLSQMFIGIRRPVISLSFLQLSRGSYTILLFPFQRLTISLSCVLQTPLPLNVARRNLGRGSLGHQLLPPVQLHPYLLPSLLRVM